MKMEGLRGSRRTATAAAMVIVMMMILSTVSTAESNKEKWCRYSCSFQCTFVPDRDLCLVQCLANCQGGVALLGAVGHCNVDCISSSCFVSQPDAKKLQGCVESCSDSCDKAHARH